MSSHRHYFSHERDRKRESVIEILMRCRPWNTRYMTYICAINERGLGRINVVMGDNVSGRYQ